MAWAARNSYSIFSASSFYNASSSWSFFNSEALVFERSSSCYLSYSAYQILFSSSSFYFISTILCYSSWSSCLRRAYCCYSYYFLRSVRSLLPLSSPPCTKVSESAPPASSILYLCASSVAFLRASSIAANSWTLFEFSGFLTASTYTTRPLPVLTSIVYLIWTFSVFDGYSCLLLACWSFWTFCHECLAFEAACIAFS